jgi:hypothetical protein
MDRAPQGRYCGRKVQIRQQDYRPLLWWPAGGFSLFRYSNPAYDAVCRALRDTLVKNQQRKGLWEGAKVLKFYR